MRNTLARLRALGRRVRHSIPFWHCSVSWDTYPFRIVWIGFWQLSYDRSGRWYERWPHMSINWNND